jgi:hypothetical protein
MVAEDVGVLRGWRRLLPELRGNLRAFGLYVVVRVVLGIAASVAVGLVTGFVAVVLAVPFLLVGGALAFALSAAGVGSALLVVAAVLAVPAVLVGLLAVGLVQAPVVVFFRYYALFVLGGVVPSLDLVSDLRADEDGGEVGADDRADREGTGEADRDDDEDEDARDEDERAGTEDGDEA